MPPTDCTLLAVKCLPQIAQIFTDAAFKGVHLRQVHPLKEPILLCRRINLLCWCTSCFIGAFFCFVGALLALASGKAERRQVHPLKDPICVDL